jgi:hypothetical protein
MGDIIRPITALALGLQPNLMHEGGMGRESVLGLNTFPSSHFGS